MDRQREIRRLRWGIALFVLGLGLIAAGQLLGMVE